MTLLWEHTVCRYYFMISKTNLKSYVFIYFAKTKTKALIHIARNLYLCPIPESYAQRLGGLRGSGQHPAVHCTFEILPVKNVMVIMIANSHTFPLERTPWLPSSPLTWMTSVNRSLPPLSHSYVPYSTHRRVAGLPNTHHGRHCCEYTGDFGGGGSYFLTCKIRSL